MKATICRPLELGIAEIDLWRSFQHANGTLASPFLTPEFACVMSEGRPDINLAILEDGGKIVGFFPSSGEASASGGLSVTASPTITPLFMRRSTNGKVQSCWKRPGCPRGSLIT